MSTPFPGGRPGADLGARVGRLGPERGSVTRSNVATWQAREFPPINAPMGFGVS